MTIYPSSNTNSNLLINRLAPARALNPKIRRYTLQKKLGEGTFGRVFLGETTIGGRQLHAAIKCIRRADENDGTLVYNEQSFNKFLTTYDKFGYFPQLIESFSDAHNFYLCSELIPGGSLRDELRRNGGRLKPERARFVMAQCLTIIEFMHHHGIMHRDIKSDNILIDAVGNVVFADLGLAHRFRSIRFVNGKPVFNGPIRMTNGHCGTPGYMAPEMKERKYYSEQVDLYALGCLFHEISYGFLPAENIQKSPALQQSVGRVASHLIDNLLVQCPLRRLTVQQAKRHSYFQNIDWVRIAERTLEMPLTWAPPCVRFGNEVIRKAVLLDKRAYTSNILCCKRDIEFIMLPRTPTIHRPPQPVFPKLRLVIPRLEKIAISPAKSGADNKLLPSLNFNIDLILRNIALPSTSQRIASRLHNQTDYATKPPPELNDSDTMSRQSGPVKLRNCRRPAPGFAPLRRQN